MKTRYTINVEYIYPPIPYRGSDWIATLDDYDGAEDSHDPIGHGATMLIAIEDLLQQIEEKTNV